MVTFTVCISVPNGTFFRSPRPQKDAEGHRKQQPALRQHDETWGRLPGVSQDAQAAQEQGAPDLGDYVNKSGSGLDSGFPGDSTGLWWPRVCPHGLRLRIAGR